MFCLKNQQSFCVTLLHSALDQHWLSCMSLLALLKHNYQSVRILYQMFKQTVSEHVNSICQRLSRRQCLSFRRFQERRGRCKVPDC